MNNLSIQKTALEVIKKTTAISDAFDVLAQAIEKKDARIRDLETLVDKLENTVSELGEENKILQVKTKKKAGKI